MEQYWKTEREDFSSVLYEHKFMEQLSGLKDGFFTIKK